MKDTDVITTTVGVIGAAAMAAGPVINQIQPGSSMHPQDWTQLVAALFIGILSYFTNKQKQL